MDDFLGELEAYVVEQIRSRRVAYLLGAGSSYLSGAGYPLASHLWSEIKYLIQDSEARDRVQEKLGGGAVGIEHALDLLDDGGAQDTPYRHIVTSAIAELFRSKNPPLDSHREFLRRIAARSERSPSIFSLNYDPLIEWSAQEENIRLNDGFVGSDDSFFDASVFQEQIGYIRGTHKGRQFQQTVKPLHLFKLHGSLGWYESTERGIRRRAINSSFPADSRPLMVPPQRRKAADTMLPPYAALWSAFRGRLAHDSDPIHRLVCIGYGLGDEHVNAVIEGGLARTDFTLLVFAKEISDATWARWSSNPRVTLVTETRSSLKGKSGPGHPDLWSFERIAREI